MIGNIRETFPPKTGMQKKQVWQDPGYVKGVESVYCMMYAMLQGCTKYNMLKELKQIKIGIIH